MILLSGLLLAFLVGTAAYAIFSRSLISSIIALSVFSTNVAALFVILQAPDVAMTEAVIGTGLVTAIFIVTLNKIEEI
jgi:energy-converting hydrogenase B subunit D